MKRYILTLPVKSICIGLIYGISITILIAGLLKEQFWLWFVSLVLLVVPVVSSRLHNKKIIADYFSDKKKSKRRNKQNTYSSKLHNR